LTDDPLYLAAPLIGGNKLLLDFETDLKIFVLLLPTPLISISFELSSN
jgi:hypothetical protein